MSSGCSALQKEQILKVLDAFDKRHFERDRLIFFIGISTGFRIAELMSLRVEDVAFTKKNELILPLVCKDEITMSRKNLKGGKKEGTSLSNRNVKINEECKEAIRKYLTSWKRMFSEIPLGSYPLFRSNKMKKTKSGVGEFSADVFERKALSTVAARDILQGAFIRAGILGRKREWACHSMRKTYAQNIYLKLNRDLPMTQKALGHANINSTVRYLNVGAKDIADASEGLNHLFLAEKEMVVLASELPNWE